mgnify:CR=1 FL=1
MLSVASSTDGVHFQRVTDDPILQGRLTAYARTWRHVKPHLTGDDLRQMGLKPGPVFREILEGLRLSRLDGSIDTRDEEIAWVKAHFSPDAAQSAQHTEAQ